jgi:protein-disulfide isomerase
MKLREEPQNQATESVPQNGQGFVRTSTAERASNAISIFVMIFAMLAIGSNYWKSHRATPPGDQSPLPEQPLSLEGAAMNGDTDAPLVLMQFTDFECPFCAKFALETFPKIKTSYIDTGRVLFALRHRPLTIHANARTAAEAMVCAGRQEKAWPLHDLLFQRSGALSDEVIRDAGEAIGLDVRTFENCLEGGASDQVNRDIEQANAAAMTSTPAFFVGVRQPDGTVRVLKRLVGALPFDVFSAALDEELGQVARRASARQ